jgi:hypothetical protein
VTARIRWEREPRGSFAGCVGTREGWEFDLYQSLGEWMLTAPFTFGNGQRSLPGTDPEELKAEAERLLEEFMSSLGASFPPEPGDPFADTPGAGHDLDDFAEGRRVRYAYPGNGYLSGREEAAELLTEGEVYTVTQRMVGTSVTYLELQGVEGHFNSVMFEPEPAEERTEEEEPRS